MKKLFVLGAAIAFIATFASCKKDHTCTCTTDSNGVSATTEITINDTKKKAEDACEELSSSSSVGGFTSSTTCKID